jgi:hypothetical protein
MWRNNQAADMAGKPAITGATMLGTDKCSMASIQ